MKLRLRLDGSQPRQRISDLNRSRACFLACGKVTCCPVISKDVVWRAKSMAKHLKTLQVCTAICHVYIIVLSIYVDYIVYIYVFISLYNIVLYVHLSTPFCLAASCFPWTMQILQRWTPRKARHQSLLMWHQHNSFSENNGALDSLIG